MARRARREPRIPEAPVALDAAGESLAALLGVMLGDRAAGFDARVGAEVDEVTLTVRPEDVPAACALCKNDSRLKFDYLRCLSVVDYVQASGEFEMNYHLYSLDIRHKMVVKTRLLEEAPVVPTVTGVWAGADWYERESADLFGVRFEGRADLYPLLLYDGFEGYPGRKSFPFHDYEEW